MYNQFSIRQKILILLMSVSTVSGLVLLFTSISTFRNDKVAYIFESNNDLMNSISDQFKSEVRQATQSAKKILQKMDADGNVLDLPSKEILDEDKVERLEVYKIHENKDFSSFSILAKRNSVSTLGQAALSQLQNQVLSRKSILTATDDYILLAGISTEGSQSFGIFTYFRSDAMNLFFEPNKSYSAFLLDSEGHIVKSDGSLKSDFINQNFSKYFSENQSLNSSTLKIQAQDGNNWLMTATAAGYENYYLVSLVNESNAMAALKGLTIKSLLIFAALFFVVIAVGIVASAYITSRLSLLSDATKKVSMGDYASMIDASGADEITDLTNNFNQMTAKILNLIDETATKARMESELQTAQLVQATLFPEAEVHYNGAHIKGKYISASECGGDWLYYNEDVENVYIWIADATGHGASAALLTSAAKSAVTIIESMKLTPSESMGLLNKAICSVSKQNMMMTCFMGQLNKKTKLLTYVNASHEAPIVIKKSDKLSKKDLVFLSDVTSARLGQDNASVYAEAHIQMESKDRILIYTDGIPDIRNSKGDALGERGFLRILVGAHNSEINFGEFTDEFSKKLEDYRESTDLLDDVAFCFTEVT